MTSIDLHRFSGSSRWRNTLLATSLGVLAGSQLVLAQPSKNIRKKERPNVLFILADDHTSQSWGIYGGILAPYVKNTNISRLASEGCVLNNCLVSNAISVPSRATILTGKYSHTNGVKTLGGSLSPDSATIAREFQQAGYQTMLIGKWHLKEEPAGFDYYCVLPGQGDYWNPRMIAKGEWLGKEQGGKHYPGYSTDIITDMTIDWLKHREKNKPFVAMCHFKATHEPYDYPERYKHLYDSINLPVPLSLYDAGAATTGRTFNGQSLESLAERYLKASADPSSRIDYMNYPRLPFSVDGLTKDQARYKTYQKFLKDYLRCAAAIDDNIGRLMNYLRENGLEDNTIVIYTSDQGYFLGEHGWFDKRMMYEEAIHMPFVIRYTREIPSGTRNNDIIENVDFSALLADYCDIPYPAQMQGRSFRDNLNGHTPADWRKYGYYRYWEQTPYHPAHFGIRGKRYKLAFYYGNDPALALKNGKNTPGEVRYWEFYDLKKDPKELHNAYKTAAYRSVIKELKQELLRQRRLLGDTDAGNQQVLEIIRKHWND